MKTSFTSNTTLPVAAPTTESRTLMVKLTGTGNGFDSGTITLQAYDNDEGEFFNVASWSSDAAVEVALGKGTQYQFVMAGATSPNVDVYHKSSGF